MIVFRSSVFLLIIFFNCAFFQIDGSQLLGVWEAYKKESINNELVESDNIDKSTSYKTTLWFQKEGKGIVIEESAEFRYNISDDTLKLGNRLYIIEHLSNNQLILRSYNELFPEGDFDSRIYFSRKQLPSETN